MRTLNEYLDALKNKTGSDYKSAIALNCQRSTISGIRKRNLMSDETAIKVADLLELKREELLIAAAIARSEGEVKNAWVSASKRFGISVGVMLGVCLTSLNSEGYDNKLMMQAIEQSIHYAKL